MYIGLLGVDALKPIAYDGVYLLFIQSSGLLMLEAWLACNCHRNSSRCHVVKLLVKVLFQSLKVKVAGSLITRCVVGMELVPCSSDPNKLSHDAVRAHMVSE